MYNTRGLSVHSTQYSTQYRVHSTEYGTVHSTEYRVDSPDLVVLDGVEGKLFEDVDWLINVQHQRTVSTQYTVQYTVQSTE